MKEGDQRLGAGFPHERRIEMIFGASDTQSRQANQQRIQSEMIYGVKEFCFFPRKLEDGRKVWLDWIWKYPAVGVRPNGELFIWSMSPDEYSPEYYVYDRQLSAKEASALRARNLV